MLDLKSLKSFDWRSLKKYTSPKAALDFNAFIDRIPQNTNQTMLIIVGVIWGIAGAMGLYTTVQMQGLTKLRAELADAKSLKPNVPEISDTAISAKEVAAFVEKTKETYPGLEIKAQGSSVTITAKTTAFFGQFREAVGHVQNGGSGWRVNIDRFCVGRECDRYGLAAVLKINKVSVKQPG